MHTVVLFVVERQTCPKIQAGILCSHQVRAGELLYVLLGMDYSSLLTLQSINMELYGGVHF